ncbi:hypothetical protein P3X46_009964 [Hevea brasiliensis]|uniref:BHLH domain-containing protein n=1 Tax=Hevea brasiliensis TaxID=3981 RepID=A0ABQ9MD35_HEVBR|nr:transcription factor FER-LIKE IRON DEFICIENCY-INDUCED TRANSCRIPTION FACTOR [Hevea brasiliensis]KAJ9178046.1 hypothetical protein P3X46_009964 [Hevea brasiliensis]
MGDASARNLHLMLDANNDFELHDFIDEANFDQFIDLIRGDNEDHQITAGFDSELINGLLVDNQFGNPTQEDVFDFSAMVPDQNFIPNITLPNFEADMKEIEEDNDGEEDSSGTITTTTTTRKTKTDRSRTLISERRRRGRMKEKLYALRSLVPNITKMDNASIIGDAVQYVQEMQMQAKKLKNEIAGLEASLAGSDRSQGSTKNLRKLHIANNKNLIWKKIIQMDVFQVEERGFYVRLMCNRGDGVAVSLYRTLESLTSFKIQSSNLTTAAETLTLTFSLNVKENEKDVNLPNLKLWITGALFNQGFEFFTALSA